MALIAIGVAMTVAACAGSSPAQDVAIDGETPRSILSAVSIVERYGPDTAIDAVLLAIERGYSSRQIQTAAVDGSLGTDGTITGESPTGPRLELIVIPDADGNAMSATAMQAAVRIQRSSGERRPVDVVREGLYVVGRNSDVQDDKTNTLAFLDAWNADPDSREGAGAAGIALIFGLADIGYSMDQIIEMIILGHEINYRYLDDGQGSYVRCTTIIDSDVGWVLPSNPTGSVCDDPDPSGDDPSTSVSGDDGSTESTSPTTTEVPEESITYTGEVVPQTDTIIGFQSVVENSVIIDRTGDDFAVVAAFAYTFAGDTSPQCLGTTSFYFEGEATLEEGSDTLLFEGIRRIEYDWQGSCSTQQSPEPTQQLYMWDLVGSTITGGFPGGTFIASP